MRSPTSSERLRLEKYRLANGPLGSNAKYGNNGVFYIPVGPESESYRSNYRCIISDTGGWEHCSVVVVSYTNFERIATWAEMCAVKNLFWREDETVVQYHPAKAEYVNVHKDCLHLWKPVGVEILMPTKEMIA